MHVGFEERALTCIQKLNYQKVEEFERVLSDFRVQVLLGALTEDLVKNLKFLGHVAIGNDLPIGDIHELAELGLKMIPHQLLIVGSPCQLRVVDSHDVVKLFAGHGGRALLRSLSLIEYKSVEF